MDAVPTFRAEHEDFRAAFWRNLVLVLWVRSTSATGLHTLIRTVDSIVRKSAGGKALLTLVESHVPSSDRHDPLAEFLTEVSSPAVVSSAVVYERTGFGAAAVRGIITALSLQRRGVEHALFNSVEEAAASLLPHLAADARRAATARDVVKLVAAVRDAERVSPRPKK